MAHMAILLVRKSVEGENKTKPKDTKTASIPAATEIKIK